MHEIIEQPLSLATLTGQATIYVNQSNGPVAESNQLRYNTIMAEEKRLIPIYTTSGEIGAFLVYPHIFNRGGEWIGWVTADQNVFSVHGQWVGRMTAEPRILRNRESVEISQRVRPPSAPGPIRVPYRTPLAPQMGDIGSNLIDVLDEASEMMPPADFGEMREDMD